MARISDALADVLREFVDAAEQRGRDGKLFGAELSELTGRGNGTVLPILKRLREQGLLEDFWEDSPLVGGPPRRYHRLAPGALSEVRGMLIAGGKPVRKTPVLTITAIPDVSIEDGGAALILELNSDDPDVGEFVRLQSYCHAHRHPLLSQLKGRRLRVTVEVADEVGPLGRIVGIR